MVEASQSLQQLLAELGEAARFESVGQASAVLPGLNVNGIGSIGVPVAPADAKRIITKASQAPYGRGTATIVDTEVRRVWQLEPSQFELRNAAWREAVAGVVDAVKRDLGIHGKVTAELYKLLVYEKGSFFKPHRDTEKIPGMFGTLVVCLPSRHEGGTLILEHDGQTRQIDFGGKDSEFQTRYVAFYADCRHEVTPVKHHCDCTHVTERKGSPQTLVCTKTQNSYERRRKQFAVDQVVLAEMEKVDGRKTSLRRTRKSS